MVEQRWLLGTAVLQSRCWVFHFAVMAVVVALFVQAQTVNSSSTTSILWTHAADSIDVVLSPIA
jgi:hypothetical protein